MLIRLQNVWREPRNHLEFPQNCVFNCTFHPQNCKKARIEHIDRCANPFYIRSIKLFWIPKPISIAIVQKPFKNRTKKMLSVPREHATAAEYTICCIEWMNRRDTCSLVPITVISRLWDWLAPNLRISPAYSISQLCAHNTAQDAPTSICC